MFSRQNWIMGSIGSWIFGIGFEALSPRFNVIIVMFVAAVVVLGDDLLGIPNFANISSCCLLNSPSTHETVGKKRRMKKMSIESLLIILITFINL